MTLAPAIGLHFSGYVTALNIRAICICDECEKSFSVQHFHAGFSETQYYYSDDSKQTLLVPYGEIQNQPTQLQKEIDQSAILEIEDQLPKPTKGNGRYRYYNPFRCKHCQATYVDFSKYNGMRPNEYYGYKYINDEFYRMENH